MIAGYECPLAGEGCDETAETEFVRNVPLSSPECPAHHVGMVMTYVEEGGYRTDPRALPADSRIGARGGVQYVGLENAVLLDAQEFSLVAPVDEANAAVGTAIALKLQGRINKTDERASLIFMTTVDGLAALVVEALALADRVGGEYRDAVLGRVLELRRAEVEAREGVAAALSPLGPEAQERALRALADG